MDYYMFEPLIPEYANASDEEIDKIGSVLGMFDVHHDFFRDLAAYFDGNQFPSDGEYIKSFEIYSDTHELTHLQELNANLRYLFLIKKFVKLFDSEKLLGSTPILKAMLLFHFYSKNQLSMRGTLRGTLKFDDPLIFLESFFAKKQSEKMINGPQNIKNGVKSLSKKQKLNMGIDALQQEIMPGLTQADINISSEILDKDYVKRLNTIACDNNMFGNIELSSEYEESEDGDELETRSIQGMSDISRIRKVEFRRNTKAQLIRKIANHGLEVQIRQSSKPRKQLAFLLIDSSGSMADDFSTSIARGVIMNRVNAVKAGNAEFYACFFNSELGEILHAYDTKSANLVAQKMYKAPSLGYDKIYESLKLAITEILKIQESTNFEFSPHIILVSDGMERTEITPKELQGVKLHTVSIGCSYDPLTNYKDLSLQSGGSYHFYSKKSKKRLFP